MPTARISLPFSFSISSESQAKGGVGEGRRRRNWRVLERCCVFRERSQLWEWGDGAGAVEESFKCLVLSGLDGEAGARELVGGAIPGALEGEDRALDGGEEPGGGGTAEEA